MRKCLWVFCAVLAAGVACGLAFAGEAGHNPTAAVALVASGIPQALTAANVKEGDTAWVLISSALVFLMTAPGLALFYGGLVRKKNILSVLMQCMMIAFLVSIQWVLFGYSLAFGPDIGNGLLGGLQYVGFKGVSNTIPSFDPVTGLSYAKTIPHEAFAIFQMMFAIITPALIVGAFAERVRFVPFCILMVLWMTIVYDPVAHWMWGINGALGFLNPSGKGAMDFAGGIVVHVNAGMAALACAIFLGKRKGYPEKISPPHNLPFAVIGAGLLWFGWFGFNAGSALASNGLAVNAFLVTHTAAAVGGLSWAVMDWLFNSRATMLGVITGAVAGLATITPASGFVGLGAAFVIGICAGVLPWLFVSYLKPILGYDDSLDAFGVHGIGGIIGSALTGVFATTAINPDGLDGALFGNVAQLFTQLKAIFIVMGYSFVVTYGLLVFVNALWPLRITDKEESIGLDLVDHRETAYTLID